MIILASEDSIDDTWVPRLMAAGADLYRVHFVKMMIERGKRRTFNLQSDLDALGANYPISNVRNSLSLIRSLPIWARLTRIGRQTFAP